MPLARINSHNNSHRAYFLLINGRYLVITNTYYTYCRYLTCMYCAYINNWKTAVIYKIKITGFLMKWVRDCPPEDCKTAVVRNLFYTSTNTKTLKLYSFTIWWVYNKLPICYSLKLKLYEIPLNSFILITSS